MAVRTKTTESKPAEAGLLRLQKVGEVPYLVERSAKRRRSFGFVVNETGVVVFRAPRWVKLEDMLAFAERRQGFIEKRLAELRQKQAVRAEKDLRKADLAGKWCVLEDKWFKKAAKVVLVPQVREWAKVVGVTVKSVRITSGRTVWGSCTSRGDINVSWRLLLVPPELREYVVVHEVCHRVHLNHSMRFWNLVGKYVPDYVEKRRALNKLGGEVG
jgi:hypothetical protein